MPTSLPQVFSLELVLATSHICGRWPERGFKMKRTVALGSGYLAASILLLILMVDLGLAGEYGFKIEGKQEAVVAFALEPAGPESIKGSGFLLDDVGHIVTTCGVLNGNYSKVCVKANGGGKYFIKKLVAKDENLDLVKVLLDMPKDRLPRLSFSEALPGLDDSLFVLGSRDGKEQIMSEGVVSALHFMPDGKKLIEITAPVYEGCCGGPVINTKGQVIGVSSPKAVGGKTIHFVIPIRYVNDLGKKNLAWSWEKHYARDKRLLGNLVPAEWAR